MRLGKVLRRPFGRLLEGKCPLWTYLSFLFFLLFSYSKTMPRVWPGFLTLCQTAEGEVGGEGGGMRRVRELQLCKSVLIPTVENTYSGGREYQS